VEEFVQTLDSRIQAISLAHGLLRKGSWDGMELSQFASAALAPFTSSGNISISGDSMRIVAEVAQSLALILHELATNAVKHGALSTASGAVALTWGRTSTGHTRITWRESGGPSVSAPSAHGFGLTVLQTAAADLGAVATCDFRKEGFFYALQGQLEVNPQRAVILPFVPSESNLEHYPAQPPRSGLRVLVVEDEALVALQLQKDLEDCGYQVVGPARSFKHGLLLANQENFDVALLDVSLGRETSIEIAEHLHSRNIPFALATGYSDLMMLPLHLREAPRLSKPYLPEDVRRCLDHLQSAARPENRAVRE
jgi:two-component sensor histidine kinase/CheY-like chemotaxis protein